MEEDLVEFNEKKTEKKPVKILENSVNHKDSVNWIIYSYFLRQVNNTKLGI